MPVKMQGIAFRNLFSKLSLQEGVVAGIGVLLFLLGLWSGSLLTKLFCFLITGIAAYYTFESLRGEEGSTVDKHEEPAFPSPPLVEEEQSEVRENPLPREEYFVPVREEQIETAVPAIVESVEQPEERKVEFEEPAPENNKIEVEYNVSDFVDDDETSGAGGQPEPKAEFNVFLQKALAVIKEVVFANSVSFFWVNRDSGQLVLESKSTDSDAFTAARKLPMGGDIVSQIAESGRPVIVTNIAMNAERDIIPYYTSLQEVKSFIGVPVFYPQRNGERQPVAVLAIDSKAGDDFGQETLALLAKFTKMLSAALKSSTEKYDLVTESELLKAETRFRTKALGDPEISAIVNALAEEVSSLVMWDALTLTVFDETQKQWVIASVRTRHGHRYVVAKQVLDFHSSIVGLAIKNNSVQRVDDLSKTTEARFLVNEPSLGMARVGSFLAVPIASGSKCYGAIALECRERNTYGPREVAAISHMASVAGMALELHDANEIIREYVIVDEDTGTVSRKYLLQRLAGELQRADDIGADVAFLLFGISSLIDLVNRYGKGAADAGIARVASILRSSVRTYDLVGRFDQSTFGVILVNTTANDAFLWAEKLRSAIASSIVVFEQKSFSVTVTVGVCGAVEDMGPDECVSNARQVLEKAKEAGGNIVRVY